MRNEDFLKWEKNPDGRVVITHPKNFKRWERRLMKWVGGSPILKRKLDRPGSDIWVLCDGKHTVADICTELDKKYREEIEPVLTRVVGFLEILLSRNLVFLGPQKGGRADMAGRAGKAGRADMAGRAGKAGRADMGEKADGAGEPGRMKKGVGK